MGVETTGNHTGNVPGIVLDYTKNRGRLSSVFAKWTTLSACPADAKPVDLRPGCDMQGNRAPRRHGRSAPAWLWYNRLWVPRVGALRSS